ncbi:hypothetical protein Csa_012614 [Cucumis sativus]|uniref:Uncharacterized protein n=1 Tax=Cucumis sativus TaxID=3659 RepID=A0A0A0L252_CUCSA|nr:hypothetical protein Csa_012614 [Cucumis sativus]
MDLGDELKRLRRFNKELFKGRSEKATKLYVSDKWRKGSMAESLGVKLGFLYLGPMVLSLWSMESNVLDLG